ncbi:DsbA family oxidoreductase [Shewanella frigidimarina]|uniref:DSBA oxidoreductase n=1 Tax=Shewanella frigidimarina (strain NCIMB 400) TaxID=318167 RepID=Q085X9_SHEFN|nr:MULTISPECIES: DsbA family oxidoreductase [Shewanella]MBB1382574.1 DsbA family oxidoreductase [Shewanella sp. SR41-2]ABI70936.1 DSBA oxidoreductase [Shewanella frigidimarina NCIMB 400]MBB1425605.1 DsbA family oxidoreductase [Shewanella sp. SG44-2]PKH99516.1 DsbA family oxidoreductase [Shewanella sp. 11B5]RPA27871.1 DsbA family oxidoreductase [Shewanella frigidimarina]|tara:strand:+ start:2988 stop:3638 length:651 start_codon:yes stop_codon:yes gene_type:complete
MATNQIQIDIISDVMCPWCIVGYRRLEQALSKFDDLEVKLQWHPFELNPAMGSEGQHLGEHIAEKYGSTPEQSAQNRQRLTQMGADLGFEFNFSDSSRIYNTLLAHQLLYWAAETGKQTDLKLALFSSYFTEQKNPDDIEVLIEAATKVGLDAAEARAVLSDKRFETAVKEEEQLWISRGIQAVPAIVFNQQYLVSGAQDPDTIAELITKLLAEAA